MPLSLSAIKRPSELKAKLLEYIWNKVVNHDDSRDKDYIDDKDQNYDTKYFCSYQTYEIVHENKS